MQASAVFAVCMSVTRDYPEMSLEIPLGELATYIEEE